MSAPDADFGVAVYDEPAGEQSVLGLRVAQQVELNGHTWQLERIVSQGTAGRMTRTTWRGASLHGESPRMGTAPGDGAGLTVDQFLPRGDRYQVTLHGTGGPAFRGALLVYRPE